MNGRRNGKHYKNNTVTLTTLKYSATVIVCTDGYVTRNCTVFVTLLCLVILQAYKVVCLHTSGDRNFLEFLVKKNKWLLFVDTVMIRDYKRDGNRLQKNNININAYISN